MTNRQLRAAQAEAELKMLERVAAALVAVAAAVTFLTSCQPAAQGPGPSMVAADVGQTRTAR